ncbi:pentapeptide repeat-containing protein [Nocardia xishanensis]
MVVADISDTVLTGANLTGADLRHSNLHDAHLTGVDLHSANPTAADLTDAVLIGVVYDHATRWPDGFRPPPRNGNPSASAEFVTVVRMVTGEIAYSTVDVYAQRFGVGD